jgi:hypothetical protein
LEFGLLFEVEDVTHVRRQDGGAGLVGIGEPGGGFGRGRLSSRASAVFKVYFGERFHGGKYTTGCGVVDVTPQPVAILSGK